MPLSAMIYSCPGNPSFSLHACMIGRLPGLPAASLAWRYRHFGRELSGKRILKELDRVQGLVCDSFVRPRGRGTFLTSVSRRSKLGRKTCSTTSLSNATQWKTILGQPVCQMLPVRPYDTATAPLSKSALVRADAAESGGPSTSLSGALRRPSKRLGLNLGVSKRSHAANVRWWWRKCVN